MQNHLSESTQEILPNTKIEIPPFQNIRVSSSENNNKMYSKKTVRRLGVRKKKQELKLLCSNQILIS